MTYRKFEGRGIGTMNLDTRYNTDNKSMKHMSSRFVSFFIALRVLFFYSEKEKEQSIISLK